MAEPEESPGNGHLSGSKDFGLNYREEAGRKAGLLAFVVTME